MGDAVFRGSVRDSATGLALQRGQVCVFVPDGNFTLWPACVRVDSISAAFRVDSLPDRRLEVVVACQTIHIIGRNLLSDSISFSATAPVLRDWVVSSVGCDHRPMRTVQGVFRGYYTPGFESSEFVPCAADAWFIPSDSLRRGRWDQRRAWARLQPGSLPDDFVWPRARRDRYGNPKYYVEWRGTVVGPGHYGHMGVSPFEILVDSVITLRAPREEDCRPLR